MDEPVFASGSLRFERPIVIAEIGGNHNGEVRRAYDLARLAVEHGADIVKFQTYSANGLVNPVLAPDRYAHFERFQLPPDEWPRLAAFVRELGGEWMTSLWDDNAFEAIEPLLPAFKVGSGDLTNLPLLRRAVATGKPLILSTAMSTMEDVRRTINFLLGDDPDLIHEQRLGLLQCTALYDRPSAPEVDLAVMSSFAREFPGVVVGYSNHYVGLDACLAALALGARIIEVHFTTDRAQTTFRDHRLSVVPDELFRLRELCEVIPLLVGSPQKSVVPAEADEVRRFRRGVYARRNLPEGHLVTEQDLVTLRPEVGVPAWRFFDLVGRRVRTAITALEPLSFASFEEPQEAHRTLADELR